MSNFYIGQKVRYTPENKIIPKGFETSIVATKTSSIGEVIVQVTNQEGGMVFSYARYWGTCK